MLTVPRGLPSWLARFPVWPEAPEAAEAGPEQKEWTANATEERQVETAERDRAGLLSGGRCCRDYDHRIAGGPLVALEGWCSQRAVDLPARVMPVQPAVVRQVGEDPLCDLLRRRRRCRPRQSQHYPCHECSKYPPCRQRSPFPKTYFRSPGTSKRILRGFERFRKVIQTD